MEIVQGLPPNYDQIVRSVGTPPKSAVYTYGGTIYSPIGTDLPEDLIVHEQTHITQQARISAKMWWDAWTVSLSFRFADELEAYRAQYKFYALKNKDRNAQARFAVALASDLAGPMYGKMTTFQIAYDRIRNLG